MAGAFGIGVLGAGRMGALHARIVATQLEGASLTAVADVDEGLARACAEVYGGRAYAGHEQLLADPNVHAVIIATPPQTHCGLIEDAAHRGKHVFCEKPIGWDLSEIDRALAAVKEAGVKLQIGFNRRFDPNFARARDVVASGEVGRLLSLLIISRDPVDQRPQGRRDCDLFLDTTIHDLDMARFLVNDDVASVYVTGGSFAEQPLDDPDTATVVLRFAGGATAVIDNTRLSGHGYDQRVEVSGTSGMVAVGNERTDTVVLAAGVSETASGPEPFFTERYFESYVREMRSFVECVTLGGEPAVTGADGRIAVDLAWACVKSYREGKPVPVRV